MTFFYFKHENDSSACFFSNRLSLIKHSVEKYFDTLNESPSLFEGLFKFSLPGVDYVSSETNQRSGHHFELLDIVDNQNRQVFRRREQSQSFSLLKDRLPANSGCGSFFEKHIAIRRESSNKYLLQFFSFPSLNALTVREEKDPK